MGAACTRGLVKSVTGLSEFEKQGFGEGEMMGIRKPGGWTLWITVALVAVFQPVRRVAYSDLGASASICGLKCSGSDR